MSKILLAIIGWDPMGWEQRFRALAPQHDIRMWPERIGNPDDPDDIDVTKKGITILDPRWHRTNDTDKKFVVLMPMRDKAGENVGLVVYAFKNPRNPSTTSTEKEYLAKSTALRDSLAKQIPSYKALFDPAK